MKPIELTIEQQFKLQVYCQQLKQINSLEEARFMLLELLRMQMVKDNIIKDLLKND
ncbi:MAG: phycobilisome degradation protein NblA [Oscillatoriales cyanobacterium]|uniref:NblA/ycf18 family protein n=1 Tax=unclassified Microcoleus TaxID=2642155 RepID=UPI001DCF7860|nr:MULTISPECIES: NblA/ycf18 family protein [unclassified Microcoleus]TAF00894.1 MAG: phycobilisome degradation protein NblA [Oscillatoriales cyanobacterium]MCC3459765.1 NblA/ycf18 family protein [Microcoleus sp. PH2017_11_PCY_U_A]MCC3478198.1 NblA/ycf18 family protein [Microcoleus sp. PH2017_12_PCY_D_A]TAF21349.1 MAG: phycobilisome degradation protein NblA [Oscillatoriales cyanobacterium]TAF39724.1 MAG: phycobilisome degradation protein NblA [Oscillatoriales cyanobacterium]